MNTTFKDMRRRAEAAAERTEKFIGSRMLVCGVDFYSIKIFGSSLFKDAPRDIDIATKSEMTFCALIHFDGEEEEIHMGSGERDFYDGLHLVQSFNNFAVAAEMKGTLVVSPNYREGNVLEFNELSRPYFSYGQLKHHVSKLLRRGYVLPRSEEEKIQTAYRRQEMG